MGNKPFIMSPKGMPLLLIRTSTTLNLKVVYWGKSHQVTSAPHGHIIKSIPLGILEYLKWGARTYAKAKLQQDFSKNLSNSILPFFLPNNGIA